MYILVHGTKVQIKVVVMYVFRLSSFTKSAYLIYIKFLHHESLRMEESLLSASLTKLLRN